MAAEFFFKITLQPLQGCSIARLLREDPKIVQFDEGTSYLDFANDLHPAPSLCLPEELRFIVEKNGTRESASADLTNLVKYVTKLFLAIKRLAADTLDKNRAMAADLHKALGVGSAPQVSHCGDFIVVDITIEYSASVHVTSTSVLADMVKAIRPSVTQPAITTSVLPNAATQQSTKSAQPCPKVSQGCRVAATMSGGSKNPIVSAVMPGTSGVEHQPTATTGTRAVSGMTSGASGRSQSARAKHQAKSKEEESVLLSKGRDLLIDILASRVKVDDLEYGPSSLLAQALIKRSDNFRSAWNKITNEAFLACWSFVKKDPYRSPIRMGGSMDPHMYEPDDRFTPDVMEVVRTCTSDLADHLHQDVRELYDLQASIPHPAEGEGETPGSPNKVVQQPVAGRTSAEAGEDVTDIKLSGTYLAAGAPLWQKRYGGSAPEFAPTKEEVPPDVSKPKLADVSLYFMPPPASKHVGKGNGKRKPEGELCDEESSDDGEADDDDESESNDGQNGDSESGREDKEDGGDEVEDWGDEDGDALEKINMEVWEAEAAAERGRKDALSASAMGQGRSRSGPGRGGKVPHTENKAKVPLTQGEGRVSQRLKGKKVEVYSGASRAGSRRKGK